MTVDAPCVARLLPLLLALLVAETTGRPRASAQDTVPPAAKKEDDRTERLDEMKQIAGAFQAVAIDGGTRVKATMAPDALYRWNDPTRDFSDGALWFWTSSGRPIGVVAIELYPQNEAFGTVWNLEFTSLSTGPIEVEGGELFDTRYADLHPPRTDGRLRWAPAKGGVEFREIPDAPAPANTEAERLRQMRELVKRFSGREHFKSHDYTLRLISHPIDRYADKASGLVDGGIYIFANGTNPEILLLIEARRRGDGATTWSYAAAPLARALVTLGLDQKDVWTHKNKDVPSPEDIYFLARRRRNQPVKAVPAGSSPAKKRE